VAHRFTNCYRAADRVSQCLITQVSYRGSQDPGEVLFRTLLFRIFNRIPVWQLLTAQLGEVSWQDYDFGHYSELLGKAAGSGERLYSAAYIMPPPPLGETRKYRNHLRLIELMMAGRAAERIAASPSAANAFRILASYPGIGTFLAYQFLTGLGYSAAFAFTEDEFTAPGQVPPTGSPNASAPRPWESARM